MVVPAGFSFKECTPQEFSQIVGTLKEKVFADATLTVWQKDILSDIESERLNRLNTNYTQNYELHMVLYKDDQMAGWSYGRQDNKESFLMANSAVMPEFRGQGCYGLLLDKVLSTVTENGFQRIWSQHNMTNNRIIIPKLKRGFVIAGTRVNEFSGAMVELVYLTSEVRRDLMNFRVGYKPSNEIKKHLKF